MILDDLQDDLFLDLFKVPETGHDGTTTKKDVRNYKRKKVFPIILVGSIIIVFLLLVLGHFLFKRCHGGGEDRPEGYYQVRVIQPSDNRWELKVNDKTGTFLVQYGTELDVAVTLKSDDYSLMNFPANSEYAYFAQVSDEATLRKTWKSPQLYYEDGKYVTHFNMMWNYDIVVQIIYEEDFESFIYTKDKETDEVLYTYDMTLYQSKSPITRVNTKTLEIEEVPRAGFNDELWIGKRVEYLDKSFLTSCLAFNKPINFAEDGNLRFINDNFLYNCMTFNQPLTFPDSLKEICGNFMYKCLSFNQPINTNKIEYLDRYPNTTFLMYGASFNSPITFGESLDAIPGFFLCNCTSFNQPITIPSTIKHIRDGFLRDCNNMVSTITFECDKLVIEEVSSSTNVCVTQTKDSKCFKEGIKVAGSRTLDVLEMWPDINDDKHHEYRHLVKA